MMAKRGLQLSAVHFVSPPYTSDRALEKVETAADFLVDAMSIMFVPATVGIMASVDALKEMLLPICVITVVATVLIMIVTGRVSQHIIRGQKNKGAATLQTVGTEAAADDKEDR